MDEDTQKYWSVVEFYPENEDETHPVSAVPNNWLRSANGVDICLYPKKGTNSVSRLIRRWAIPEDTERIHWDQCRVSRVLNRNPIATYSEAKSLEKKSLNSSDIDNLRDETLSKKQRAERHKKSVESSDESADENDVSHILVPPPPDLPTGNGNKMAASHQQQRTELIPLPEALRQPPERSLPTSQELLLLSPPSVCPTAPIKATLTAAFPPPPPPPPPALPPQIQRINVSYAFPQSSSVPPLPQTQTSYASTPSTSRVPPPPPVVQQQTPSIATNLTVTPSTSSVTHTQSAASPLQTLFQQTPALPITSSAPLAAESIPLPIQLCHPQPHQPLPTSTGGPSAINRNHTFTPPRYTNLLPQQPPLPTVTVMHQSSTSTPPRPESSHQPQHQETPVESPTFVSPQTDSELSSDDGEYQMSKNDTPVTRRSRGFGKRSSNSCTLCCCGRQSCERYQFYGRIADAVFDTHKMVHEQYMAKKKKQASKLSSFLNKLKFPISTVAEFEDLNHEIETNKDSMADLIKKLQSHCGGASVQACVYQALKWLISNHVANSYNWKNRHNNEAKHAMAGMPFINAIYEAVDKREGITDCSFPAVETYIKQWFRQAVNRIPELRQKKTTMPANNTTGASETSNYSWASAPSRTPPSRRRTNNAAQSQSHSPQEQLQNDQNQSLIPSTSYINHAVHSQQRFPSQVLGTRHIYNGSVHHSEYNSSTRGIASGESRSSTSPLNLHVERNPHHSTTMEWVRS